MTVREVALLSCLIPVFNFDELYFCDKTRMSLAKVNMLVAVFTAVTPAALLALGCFVHIGFGPRRLHFVFRFLTGEI